MYSFLNEENKKEVEAITKKREKVQQQEEIALCVGRTFLRQGNQKRATEFFSRANVLFQQRNELEKQILSLFGVNIDELSFVNSLQL